MNLPDPDEYVDVKRYGLGIPFGFLAFGLILSAWVFPGLTGFQALTQYGKLGVVIVVCVIVACFIAAKHTYQSVETRWYKMTKEEDGPAAGDGE